MLNIIWPLFIIISFIYAIFTGRIEQANNAIFESTELAVELTITLLGTMCLWNGLMQIASQTSMIEKLTKMLNPVMKMLFPDIKKEDPLHKEIAMNMIANIMGLGNAATPAGLKAMKLMQNTNKEKKVLSNSMGMFIVLNTASIQLIPTTVIAIRSSLRFRKTNRDDSSCMDCNNICCNKCYCECKTINEKDVKEKLYDIHKLFF